MKTNSLKLSLLPLALTTAGLFAPLTYAAPPVTSPYVTDAQDVHVQDATSDGIGSLNMVLCIVKAINAASQVNAGPYVALVDKSKCDTSSQGNASNASSTSAGASASTDYINAIVNVTRASDTTPMIAKIWMSLDEQGKAMEVDGLLSVTQAPGTTLPYGAFHFDYLGKANGSVKFNGFIDASTSAISFYETDYGGGGDGGGGGGSQSQALTLVSSSTSAGAGTMASGGTTFNFAYNSTLFRRSDAVDDVCFDRAAAHANKSVWSYGTYKDSDGTRIDLDHAGFPLLATYSGSGHYGYASYWGINFQGLDLNSLPDSNPISGLTIADQRPGNSTTYSLSKLSGVLTKYTLTASTLADIDGFPLQAGGNFSNLNPAISNNAMVEMHWDNHAQQFVITGQQSCSNNGCTVTPLAGNISVTFNGWPDGINGYSQALGGPISIAPSVGYTATSPVNHYSQHIVLPGSTGAPTALNCLNNCVTSASLAGFTGNNSPFDAGTSAQWYSGTNQVNYTFDSHGLEQGGNSVVAPNMSSAIFSGFSQSGIQTGKLYEAALTVDSCPSTYCEPNSDYFTWQTGPNQWNQSLWLNNGSSVVQIDAPLNISYVVQANDDSSGNWVGKTIQLQFSGFGNLNGIPGNCVNPVDNTPVACGQNVRFVPAFAIADGNTMTIGGVPAIIKALNAELRLSNVNLSQCTSAGLNFSPQTPPTAAGLHDPSSATDTAYLGVKPTVTGTPKVVDGVVQ